MFIVAGSYGRKGVVNMLMGEGADIHAKARVSVKCFLKLN